MIDQRYFFNRYKTQEFLLNREKIQEIKNKLSSKE